jgi:hypothetical protein
MRALLDVNVLIALHDKDHINHSQEAIGSKKKRNKAGPVARLPKTVFYESCRKADMQILYR